MDKSALRREMSARKRALSEAEIAARSAVLAEKLCHAPQYLSAKALYIYLSFNQEVRTKPIIERAWAEGKRVAVPKVFGDELRFIWLERFDQLTAGFFGIEEPAADGPVADDPAALIVLPGLAFDREGRRLGYGGGFYDRYLRAHPGHPTLALCYDFQLLPHLDAEAHDIPADAVLTDE